MLGATMGAREYLDRVCREIRRLDAAQVERLSDLIEAAYRDGRAVFICGNGGSGANASHLCEDLAKCTLRDFESQPNTHAKGGLAEDAAETYLRSVGYKISERNLRTKLGEIDFVALDGEVLCFVEVKARLTAEFGRAIEAVGPRKRARLARIASLVLAKNRSQRACRFDVLGLDRNDDGSWGFTLIKDAIQLDRI